jgi:hypothetical protein
MDDPIETREERDARLDEEIESDLNRDVNADLRRIHEWRQSNRNRKIRNSGPISKNKKTRQSAGKKRRKTRKTRRSKSKK